MRRVDIDEEPTMSYHELSDRIARQRRRSAAKWSALLDDQYDYEGMDDTDGLPLPWTRAFGIACLIVAGLILGYMVYNN